MRAISLETLGLLNKDNFYRSCCLCGASHVQYHHHLIFGGQQCDEPETILPLCPDCHSQEKRRDINEKLSWIMLNRMNEQQIKKYSKIENLAAKLSRLNQIYGKFSIQ
jgi:hypothetical protein